MKVYVITNTYRKDSSVRLFWDLRSARVFVNEQERELDEFNSDSEGYKPNSWEHVAARPPKEDWQDKKGYDLTCPAVEFPWWGRGDWHIRVRVVHGGSLTALAHCAEESA